MARAILAHTALPLGGLFIICLSLFFLDLHGLQRGHNLSPARHAKAYRLGMPIFLTMPTQKNFDQLLVYVNLYQHPKNQAISLNRSGAIVD